MQLAPEEPNVINQDEIEFGASEKRYTGILVTNEDEQELTVMIGNIQASERRYSGILVPNEDEVGLIYFVIR